MHRLRWNVFLVEKIFVYQYAGLPHPIIESVSVLQRHVYIPLSDIQIAEEEKIQQQKRLSIAIA